eukprot:sb/3469344/
MSDHWNIPQDVSSVVKVLLLNSTTGQYGQMINLTTQILEKWPCSPINTSFISPLLVREPRTACRALLLLLRTESLTLTGLGELYGTIMTLIRDPKKLTYGPAGSVLGHIMGRGGVSGEQVDEVHSLLLSIHRDPLLLNKFLSLVHLIGQGHPDTVVRFTSKLLDSLPKVSNGRLLGEVLAGLKHLHGHEVVAALLNAGLEKFLRTSNVGKATVEVLKGNIGSIDQEEVYHII